ncbi:MAG: hypothetical protein KDC84_16000 [Crocinitomicaceae bacterium]|nr:hypothetical protein [Crocinitomicaceae bacterium]
MKDVWVTDANVFIDVDDMELVDEFCQLGHRIFTTSFVWAEVNTSNDSWRKYIKLGKLVIENLSSKDRLEALSLREGNLSEADTSVLWMAIQKQQILLTGEKKLRSLAMKNQVEVHGTLWILDRLVNQSILSNAHACEALKTLMKVNIRLPKVECQQRMNHWC